MAALREPEKKGRLRYRERLDLQLVGPAMDPLICGPTSGGASRAGAPQEHTHGQPLC